MHLLQLNFVRMTW